MDDLKNEIALSIYKAVSKYPDSGTFLIYLNKTIDRTLLNHLRKINNKKDKVYQESIKTDNDQDFQDNRYNPEQLFFEISSYNNLKRKNNKWINMERRTGIYNARTKFYNRRNIVYNIINYYLKNQKETLPPQEREYIITGRYQSIRGSS